MGDVHGYVNSCRCARWCIGKVQGAGRRAGRHVAGLDDESKSYWPGAYVVMHAYGSCSLCWTGLVKCCLEQEEVELWFDQDVARRGDPEASVVCCLAVDVMESRPAALRD